MKPVALTRRTVSSSIRAWIDSGRRDGYSKRWKLIVPAAERPTKPQTTRDWQDFTGVILRDAGKVAAVDRIAVMAALNLANELLRTRAGGAMKSASAPIDDGRAQRRIQAMQSAIDQVMAGQDKLI